MSVEFPEEMVQGDVVTLVPGPADDDAVSALTAASDQAFAHDARRIEVLADNTDVGVQRVAMV